MTLTSTGDNRKQSLSDDVREGSSSISTNVADRSNSNHLIPLSPEQQRELEEELPEIEQELTDSEEEDEFIRRFGDIEFQYIKPPKQSVWFRRERTSAKTELFLDLLYVGIIANLAGEASEEAGGKALLKYVLLFLPTWVIWADIKDFTNYYYNEDLSQKMYIFWILALLTLYINSHYALLNSTDGAALTIVPYILCRLSLAVSYFVYSFFIPEHRAQSRLYAAMVTTLNIEHEVERFSSFVTIAIGEFLYKVVAPGNLGVGFSAKFARGLFLLANAYILFWIYQYGSTSNKAIHPLRHSAWTAISWIYAHAPLIAALVLAADAGGDLASLDNTSTAKHHSVSEHGGEEEEKNMYALSFFYTGGICVSLVCMFILGLVETSRDPPELFVLPKNLRIALRLPIAIIIVLLSLAELNTTLLMGLVTMLLGI
ncbi:Bacterial low temperature requirement A protein (LtrA) family protein [Candida albicans]|uniref:Bacterial low temperature requirement A protein (LtrA) family protein n=1 Tax=Candida albicans TaxID=5476 RepID=A0A8H6BUV5_CANAX|nr:Bacterial low temperature requirement A protein (LtrA) family protein [Candida albicans]